MSATATPDVSLVVKKWKDKRGSLIMALHDLQSRYGYVPRDAALALAKGLGVSLARIYEVVTFYNYFKLEAPGKFIISVCTGTACHIKGAGTLLHGLEQELGIKEGSSTADKEFHLQGVRCLGCCGLAPLVSVNGKVYGKLAPTDGPAVLAKIKIDKPMVAAESAE
jgi:NADH-quinone oxidoreductase subunit E